MKNIIITGGSGGIGGAVAKIFLQNGWHIHMLLRSFENLGVQQMMNHENVSVYKSNPEDTEITKNTIQSIKDNGISIDFVFHSAGTFMWDDGFPKEKKSFIEVKEILFRSNIETKISVVEAIESVYEGFLGDIEQGFIGSHAANFAPDGPERTGKYQEEAYVEVMSLVQSMATKLLDSRKYKNVFLVEPGLIDTAIKQAFTEERLGFKIDPSSIISAEDYANEIFPEIFFLDRQ